MEAVKDAVWGTLLRKSLTAFFSTIAAIAAAVVAVPPAWTAIGLPEVASKMFVHEQVDPIKTAQTDTTRAVWSLSLAQLQSSLYAAQQDKIKAPSATVDQRIQDLQQQIQQVQAKISAGH
jgi:hypothetical protein